MKIPIQLQFKLFDDTFIVKKNVEVLHIKDIAEMYQSVFVPIFGEESYENTIMNIAESIKIKREKHNQKIIEQNKPKNIIGYIKKILKLKR
jgi:hypothetical protein